MKNLFLIVAVLLTHFLFTSTAFAQNCSSSYGYNNGMMGSLSGGYSGGSGLPTSSDPNCNIDYWSALRLQEYERSVSIATRRYELKACFDAIYWAQLDTSLSAIADKLGAPYAASGWKRMVNYILRADLPVLNYFRTYFNEQFGKTVAQCVFLKEKDASQQVPIQQNNNVPGSLPNYSGGTGSSLPYDNVFNIPGLPSTGTGNNGTTTTPVPSTSPTLPSDLDDSLNHPQD